jgi:hypothetical protein
MGKDRGVTGKGCVENVKGTDSVLFWSWEQGLVLIQLYIFAIDFCLLYIVYLIIQMLEKIKNKKVRKISVLAQPPN